MNGLPNGFKRHGFITVLAIGPADYDDQYTWMDGLDRLLDAADARNRQLVVIEGGTPGAAALARLWADHNEEVLLVSEVLAWDLWGPDEGRQRIEDMMARHQIDVCLAIPDDAGRAVDYTIRRCQEENIPILTPPLQAIAL